MIVTKTPLRISFVGGGTDIAWFYREHGGAVISTAIDKFVTVKVSEGARERGSEGARENPIVRACLQKVGIDQGVSIEIESDVAAGTGLGSSSALTVGLLNALYAHKRRGIGRNWQVNRQELARLACEIEVLGKPIGKQDQYAVTYGGFRRYVFEQDGGVDISTFGGYFPFKEQIDRLEPQLLLFDTHIQRSADTVLESQRKRNDVASLLKIKTLEEEFYNCLLIGGDIDTVGQILHEGWTLKRGLSELTTNPAIDAIYRLALDAGALGGKLLGAGGGGHFLFYVRPDDQEAVKVALDGLATHVPFAFEAEGTRLV